LAADILQLFEYNESTRCKKIRRRAVMRRRVCLTLAVTLAGVAPCLYGQDQKAEVQKRLTSQFTRTKLTADRSDIVKAGSVLELHKDGLLMCSIEAKYPPTSTYKNGSISMGFGANLTWTMGLSSANQQVANIAQRKFVAGEKFWVTDYFAKDDGVYLQFYSDPFNNVRYYGQLKLPFPKGKFPPADDVMKTVAEVVTVDNTPPDAPSPDTATSGPATSDSTPESPKTITVGLTKDQVIAILGQPQKIVDLGTKQMYYYPDMKVIFIDGKVTDVQ
jgi:hypothetical protein